jgi:hypothetical protein
MYKGLSYSPQYGSFAFGIDPGPSDLENLVAGRERKITDLMGQSVFECLLGGNVDICLTTRFEHIRWYFGAIPENGIGSVLISQGGLKCRDERR